MVVYKLETIPYVVTCKHTTTYAGTRNGKLVDVQFVKGEQYFVARQRDGRLLLFDVYQSAGFGTGTTKLGNFNIVGKTPNWEAHIKRYNEMNGPLTVIKY